MLSATDGFAGRVANGYRPMFLAKRRNLIALLVAAGGGPYFVNETEVGRKFWNSGTQLVSSVTKNSGGVNGNGNPLYETEQLWKRSLPPDVTSQAPLMTPLVGGPVNDLRDVLRFDINPEWVFQHFSRVTTVLAEMHLDGLRIPIVTGTSPEDVAGTLTYYFDRQHQVQRVTLHGFTGDPTRLTELMQKHYQMQPQPSLGAGTYVIRWNGQPTSILQLTHAPVVHAAANHTKYTVFLELNQPSMPYGLSDAANRLVSADKSTFRW